MEKVNCVNRKDDGSEGKKKTKKDTITLRDHEFL